MRDDAGLVVSGGRVELAGSTADADAWVEKQKALAPEVVDLDGRIYAARDIAYAGDTNTEYDPAGHALVEVVGNFEETQPSQAQLDAVVRVMSWLAKKHGVTEGAIAGHRNYAKTDCPGRNLYRYLENGWIRQQVKENLASYRP